MLKNLLSLSLLILAGLNAAPAFADYNIDQGLKKVDVLDSNDKSWTLTRVSAAIVVDSSLKDAWEKLAEYGDVQHVSANIVEAGLLNDVEFGVGCERYCAIDFNGKDVYVEERIIEIETGRFYTYDVFDWKNFPIKKMHVTFGVRTNPEGQTELYNIIDYQLKPRVMTPMMRRQMAQSALNTVRAYKYSLENSGATLSNEELEEIYGDKS